MKMSRLVGTNTNRLLLLGVLLVAPALVVAQDGGPVFVNARVVTVKADRVAQWESLQKEATEGMQASGQAFRHIFQRIQGPLDTYLIITPGDGAGIPVTENWINSVDATIASRQANRLRAYVDAFTVEGGATAVPSEYLHVRLRTTIAGRSDDYYEWQRDELIPELRSAGVGDVRTLRVALGGNIRTWVSLSFVDNLPGSGGPNLLAESMGEQAMERMITRGNAMISGATDYFYQFRSDLSFDAN